MTRPTEARRPPGAGRPARLPGIGRPARPPGVGRLPQAPGVYRFRDGRGRILYLGRAASLRSRVASYWGSLGDRAHLSAMVQRIAEIEAVQCDSEHEAAWLERNLLERRLPPWNRTRGGQEVPVYIRLDERPGTAGLAVVHLAAPCPGTRHFGPYLGGLKARLVVSALHRVLPLAHTADRRTGAARDLARVLGIDPADRVALAGAIAAVLDRDAAAVASLRAELVRRRDLAAGRLDFESAARRQGELEAVEWIVAEQKATLAEPADFDVCGWADGMLVRFQVRDGRVCSWSRRGCTQARARPLLAATPPRWRQFGQRSAELAARLADPGLAGAGPDAGGPDTDDLDAAALDAADPASAPAGARLV